MLAGFLFLLLLLLIMQVYPMTPLYWYIAAKIEMSVLWIAELGHMQQHSGVANSSSRW